MSAPANPSTPYQAARFAYGAADALCRADAWGRDPILADQAAEYRAQAREALTTALAILDSVQ